MNRIDTARELIAAGRKALATKYHPDVIGGDAEQMQEVNAAADWLIEGLPFSATSDVETRLGGGR